MRNTIILGSFAAILGLGSVAVAIAETERPAIDTVQINQEASKEGRGDRLDRHEAKDRRRGDGDEAAERRGEPRERKDETRERNERR